MYLYVRISAEKRISVGLFFLTRTAQQVHSGERFAVFCLRASQAIPVLNDHLNREGLSRSRWIPGIRYALPISMLPLSSPFDPADLSPLVEVWFSRDSRKLPESAWRRWLSSRNRFQLSRWKAVGDRVRNSWTDSAVSAVHTYNARKWMLSTTLRRTRGNGLNFCWKRALDFWFNFTTVRSKYWALNYCCNPLQSIKKKVLPCHVLHINSREIQCAISSS